MVKDMQRRDPVQARVAQDAMDAKGGKQERLDAVIEEGVAAARGVLEAGSTLGILFAKLDENLAQSAIRIPVEDVPAVTPPHSHHGMSSASRAVGVQGAADRGRGRSASLAVLVASASARL